MSDTETKTRVHIEADGIIRPDDVCTIKGAKKIWGLSRGQLDDARSSGIVKPTLKGGELRFKGSEVIQWLFAEEK